MSNNIPYETTRMRFAQLDIDVAGPLPGVALGPDESGLAVLVRRQGRPVGFWMEALPPGTRLTPEEVAGRIGRRAGAALARASLREELAREESTSEAYGRLPSLTIAVCTRDRPALLGRCLDALQALPPVAHALSCAPQILVVDNAPPDEATRELVAARPGVRYVREPRPGLDFARNRAACAAETEWIAYVDDDAFVDHGWLEGLAEAWGEHPDAAAVTGLVLPAELETEAQILFEERGGFRRGFEKVRYHGPRHYGNPLYPCGAGIFGAGANMAFRREVLLELGGFDEALDTGPPLPGGGDLDMFYRVVRAGYPLVYEPRYLVFHRHRRTMRGLRRQYESWGRGFMAFLVKAYRTDPSQRRKLLLLIAWWLRSQGRQLRASRWGEPRFPARLVLAELWGGLAGLLGAYNRSLARTERIRREHRPAPPLRTSGL